MAIAKRPSIFFHSILLASMVSLVACGGGGGGGTKPPAIDTTPNAISFAPTRNAEPSAVVTSQAITISGINTAAPISISGGEYAIAGGAFTATPGTVTNSQSLVIRITASDKTNTPKEATLTVGGVSAKFTVTTLADTTPDAFSFPAKTEAAFNTEYTSDAITVKGIDVAVPISLTGGTYSINGGAFTSAAGTVSVDQTITVKTTSASKTESTQNAVLTVGGVDGTFAVTTVNDTFPPVAEFKFPTPYTMSEASEVKVRGTATDDNEITSVKLLVRSFNLATPTVTISEKEIDAIPKSETNGVKDFSSWTAVVPLAENAENEIKVVATDARNNANAPDTAKQVKIRQADVKSAFPNNTNPFVTLAGGIVVDKYDDRNRLLVSDPSARKVWAVSFDSGERTIYRSYGFGYEFDDLAGLLIVEASEDPVLYALDPTAGNLLKLNLPDGALIGSHHCDACQQPFSLILDSTEGSAKLVTINGGLSSDSSSDVIAFDLNEKSFSTISPDRDHSRIPYARAIGIDKTGNRYLAAGGEMDNNLYGIYSIHRITGERQIFSNNEVGGGELFNRAAFFEELAVDDIENMLYAPDYRSGKIYAIDLLNGNRRIIAELKYEDNYGNLLPRGLSTIRLVTDNQYAFLADSKGDALIVVDLISGEKVILSKSKN
jgi:hypothetical protein